MILLSPIEQYLPMEITTCCPAVDRRRSPLSITPDYIQHFLPPTRKRLMGLTILNDRFPT